MIQCLVVGIGGAIGAICRYLVGLIPAGTQEGFPLKTFAVNVAGAFVIGIIAALAEKYTLPPMLVLLLKTGVCGGFTTFSTFALETNQLLHQGNILVAVMYISLSVTASVAAVFLAQACIQ